MAAHQPGRLPPDLEGQVAAHGEPGHAGPLDPEVGQERPHVLGQDRHGGGTSPDGRPAVYVTHDAGESWVEQRQGLPERGWLTVKRQAMTTDRGGYGPDGSSVGVYFGTTGGEVWASLDGGDNWSVIAQHLPEIYAIECGYATGADAL